MSTSRTMTKSPLALAREALSVGQAGLPLYGSVRSRHDFTLPQLFAMLVLREFFKTDYRGMVQLLEDLSDLREVLGLKKAPHFTTLQKAKQRLEKGGPSLPCSTPSSSEPQSAASAPMGRPRWTPRGLRAATSAAISLRAAVA